MIWYNAMQICNKTIYIKKNIYKIWPYNVYRRFGFLGGVMLLVVWWRRHLATRWHSAVGDNSGRHDGVHEGRARHASWPGPQVRVGLHLGVGRARGSKRRWNETIHFNYIITNACQLLIITVTYRFHWKYRISGIFRVGKIWRKWCLEGVLNFHWVLFALFQGLSMKTYSRVYFSLCLFLVISGRSRTQRKLNPREQFPIYGRIH